MRGKQGWARASSPLGQRPAVVVVLRAAVAEVTDILIAQRAAVSGAGLLLACLAPLLPNSFISPLRCRQVGVVSVDHPSLHVLVGGEQPLPVRGLLPPLRRAARAAAAAASASTATAAATAAAADAAATGGELGTAVRQLRAAAFAAPRPLSLVAIGLTWQRAAEAMFDKSEVPQ